MLVAGAIVALGLSVLVPLSTSDGTSGCAKELQLAGLCGTNNNTEIIIDGTRTVPGVPNPDPNMPDTWVPDSNTPWVSPEEALDRCLAAWDDYIGCFRAINDDESEAEEDTVEIPAVTINDVARFAPEGSPLAGEPDNVGVAGLPTNFVATASAHTVDGELFGFPVTVRFTPAAFDFTYGDGASQTTASGGQSWDALNHAQFTPTPTSHTYSDRGTYSASVDVRYTAEVDFGVGWFPITGEVTATGPAQEIRIFEAHTALVAHTCEQAPDSPGC